MKKDSQNKKYTYGVDLEPHVPRIYKTNKQKLLAIKGLKQKEMQGSMDTG